MIIFWQGVDARYSSGVIFGSYRYRGYHWCAMVFGTNAFGVPSAKYIQDATINLFDGKIHSIYIQIFNSRFKGSLMRLGSFIPSESGTIANILQSIII